MVKNKTGGNKGKKFGRKHLGGNSFNAKLRISQEEDEVYACVTKLLGNGSVYIIILYTLHHIMVKFKNYNNIKTKL